MSEDVFRGVLAAAFLALLPVLLYFRLRSQSTGERLDRWQEGPFLLFGIRLVGLAHAAGLIAYLIHPPWMAWSSLPLPPWLRWAGVALGAAAAGLIFWTFRNLGRNLTDTVVTRREHTLVTSGPYRWVRHPFYVAFAAAAAANALVTANWFIAATGAAAVSLLVARTGIEEAKLVERFGDSYREYMQRTGRFWPKRRGR